MALQKNTTLPNGATGNYWKIIHAFLDKKSNKVNCNLSLFVNAAFKDSQPIKDIVFVFDFSQEETTGNIIQLCYEKIKSSNNDLLVDCVDA